MSDKPKLPIPPTPCLAGLAGGLEREVEVKSRGILLGLEVRADFSKVEMGKLIPEGEAGFTQGVRWCWQKN